MTRTTSAGLLVLSPSCLQGGKTDIERLAFRSVVNLAFFVPKRKATGILKNMKYSEGLVSGAVWV